MCSYDLEMDMKQMIGLRIRASREAKGMTLKDLAARTKNLSASRISNYEQGLRTPGPEEIVELASALGESAPYLMALESRSLHGIAEPLATYDLNVIAAPIATRRVPLISWVQAGNWCPVADPYPPGAADAYVSVDIRVSDGAFALTVRGDSMLNPNTGEGFPEGCIIVVDPGVEHQNGHYVVVRLDDSDEATFKQLVIDGSKRYLRPLNPRYPIIEINGNASICGVVKKMIIERNF